MNRKILIPTLPYRTCDWPQWSFRIANFYSNSFFFNDRLHLEQQTVYFYTYSNEPLTTTGKKSSIWIFNFQQYNSFLPGHLIAYLHLQILLQIERLFLYPTCPQDEGAHSAEKTEKKIDKNPWQGIYPGGWTLLQWKKRFFMLKC